MFHPWLKTVEPLHALSTAETQRNQQGTISVPLEIRFGSVAEIWDVIVGVTPVTPGRVVGDSQVVKSREEEEPPYDDDGDGAVRML